MGKAFQISPRIPTDTLLESNPLLKAQDSESSGALGDFVVIFWVILWWFSGGLVVVFLGDFMVILW